MKKNRMMRLASILLVLTLISTCAISGTFAKYTTEVTGSDSARVACWGFDGTDAEVVFTNLFTDTYTNVATTVTNENVIAPGTEGSANFQFKYDGAKAAPEVKYSFTVDTSESECGTDISANTNIQWKLDDGSYGTWTELMTAIKTLSGNESGTKDYEPKNLPEEFNADNKVHTISWKWEIGTTADDDVTDTGMGNAIELDKVKISIKITATQID